MFVLTVFLISFVIINFVGFERFCTPDMYEDTIVARYMWEQKTVFPANWVFGNQLYTVATPVLSALIYGICGSINLSMAISTSIMTAAILFSFAWMVMPFVKRRDCFPGMLALVASVLGPGIVYCIEGQTLFLMAAYYACYLITMQLAFGVYVRLYSGTTSCSPFSIALALALSFLTGMQSLRQTALEIIPMLAVTFLLFLIAAFRHGGKQFFRERRSSILFTLAALLFNVCGYILTKLLSPPQQVMQIVSDWYHFTDGAGLLRNLYTDVRALVNIAGLRYLAESYPVTLLGISALFFALSFVLAIFLRRRLPEPIFLLHVLLSLGILCTMLISTVTDVALRDIYLFPWHALAGLSVLELFISLRSAGKRLVLIGLVICSAFSLYLGYYPCVKTALQETGSEEQEISDFISDHGYSILYGDWYQAAPIAVRADGDYVLGAWSGELFHILGYINTMDVYGDEDNDNAVYMLTSGNRDLAMDIADSLGATLEKVAEFGTIELYTSSKQLMHF